MEHYCQEGSCHACTITKSNTSQAHDCVYELLVSACDTITKSNTSQAHDYVYELLVSACDTITHTQLC